MEGAFFFPRYFPLIILLHTHYYARLCKNSIETPSTLKPLESSRKGQQKRVPTDVAETLEVEPRGIEPRSGDRTLVLLRAYPEDPKGHIFGSYQCHRRLVASLAAVKCPYIILQFSDIGESSNDAQHLPEDTGEWTELKARWLSPDYKIRQRVQTQCG